MMMIFDIDNWSFLVHLDGSCGSFNLILELSSDSLLIIGYADVVVNNELGRCCYAFLVEVE